MQSLLLHLKKIFSLQKTWIVLFFLISFIELGILVLQFLVFFLPLDLFTLLIAWVLLSLGELLICSFYLKLERRILMEEFGLLSLQFKNLVLFLDVVDLELSDIFLQLFFRLSYLVLDGLAF